MSKTNNFDKGVEVGLKISQKLINQEAEALNYLKNKIDLIREGHDEMKNAVNLLLEDVNEDAVSKLFSICNPVRPSELKDHEQKLLINLLASLSAIQSNDFQKKYFNNLRHHLNLSGYEPNISYDYRKIEFIESIQAIKTIAKAVRIYLFLEESNMDGIYKHEDDIFSHFELRSFDEIDAMIETIFALFGIDGLIDFYGNFVEIDEAESHNCDYLNVEKKEQLEISNECAQIYFKDCYEYNNEKVYIESSSYVIFNEGTNILCIHKTSGIQKILLQNIQDSSKYIRDGKITTYQDMLYYLIDNELCFIDINSLNSGKIVNIDEEKDDNGKISDISKLMVYKGVKILFRNKHQYYIMDLQQGPSSIKQIPLDSDSNNYFMKGDYLYYVEMDPVMDSKELEIEYRLKRFGILNGQDTNVSAAFGRHKSLKGLKNVYEIEAEGIYGDNYFCVFGYQSVFSFDKNGYDCFYFNIEDSNAKPKSFYIWNNNIFQMEHYKNYLIYVNADKSYSLTRHDFAHDKKTVLHTNYGESEKSTFWERFNFGKSLYMNPSKYMRLGNWVWIKDNNKFEPSIISIS